MTFEPTYHVLLENLANENVSKGEVRGVARLL